MDLKNLSIVRQYFGTSVFTHKTQEVAAELQESNAHEIKVVNLILVSLVLITLILQFYYPFFGYISILLTVVEIIFLIFQLSFKFEEKVILHKNSALKYLGLRNCYTSLITDIMNKSITTREIMTRRDALLREYQVICDLAPQTGRREYQEAQKRLNKRGVVEGEEFTWSDEEIDRFLPKELQLKKRREKGGERLNDKF